MKAPAFWWRKSGLASGLLAPVSLLYGTVAGRRMGQPGARAGIPVICIGNMTVGGAGKTPTAIALAALLCDLGRRPAFLLRGYGGRLAGPVAVDPARHGYREVGDEALLLARYAPTIVARDRPAGAALAARTGADVVVMDDGMQNPSLAKDLTLAVFDGSRGIGNGQVLPAGPLRGPLAAQWPTVDACVIVGPGEGGRPVRDLARRSDIPMLESRLVAPDRDRNLAGMRVLALSGIGNPAKFTATLRGIGADIVRTRAFPDHYAFAARDVRQVLRHAAALGACVVTTEKDMVRLAPLRDAVPEIDAIRALPVRLVFDDPAALRVLVERAIG